MTFQALYSSHMNSLAGHLNLLDRCECDYFISAKGVKVDDIISARPEMRHFLMPELDELLDEQAGPVPNYPYEKTFEQAKADGYLILHTSGSTGLPKPVVITHGVGAAIDSQSLIPHPEVDGRPLWIFKNSGVDAGKTIREFAPFPPFHVIASTVMIGQTVFGNTIYIFGPRDRMPTPQACLDIMEHAHARKAFLSPALLEEFANMRGALEKLAGLDEILYGGGVLSQSAGSRISSVTRLTNTWGSTENGMPTLLQTDREDWAYIAFEPFCSGIQWREHGDRLFEMVFVRKPDTVRYQTTFAISPEAYEWPTRDIWSKHPTKAHHWRYEGRLDDLICFSDGNKYHPISEETRLCSHPLIKSAIMVGERRRQPALLLELRGSFDHEDALEKVWPAVAEGNAVAPSVGQVAKTHILFASPEKPFARAGKGTVQRYSTTDLYKDEIDGLYARYGDKGAPLVTRVKS
jgi:acyl-coenzyme A synthetase/AMP-(fatty) acid ligase